MENRAGVNFISLNKTSIKGYPAYVYTYTFFNTITLKPEKEMVINTIIGDYNYYFEYLSDLSRYDKYLDISKRMINSFDIDPFVSAQVKEEGTKSWR